ncbi:hypothetical protein CBM2586_A11689 [Cupriavidus phytorum]|uniref:Uncharacterized protein n=1 Tax=Cupriavidus taiwanensis TaxID=164546 RepID=A0A375BET2_9BURK|nr:hypothetical protein CBM2586_A11689 [Cupriavidus taiwanensis]
MRPGSPDRGRFGCREGGDPSVPDMGARMVLPMERCAILRDGSFFFLADPRGHVTRRVRSVAATD